MSSTRGINTRGGTLRQYAARGTLVNTAFTVGLSLLALLRGFVLAALLTTQDYGVWGLLAASLGTLLWLKQVGIGDKYIQQEEADQELAFQKAFTLEALATGAFMLLLLVALPIYAVIYGEAEIIGPGLALLATLPAGVLQAPLWVLYRNMEFGRQRLLQSIDPVLGFAVALALALAGAGYWALIGGVVAGAWTTALAAVIVSPYPIRLRYDRGTFREYFSFSWPLLMANGSSLVIAQGAVIVLQRVSGLAAVGAMALTYTITSFTERVDQMISLTLYPAICAVRDRVDLLEESFVKSNRLGLMWAMPFGCGIGLFASDLVTFGLGEEWRITADLLAVTGFNAALAQVAFNWDAYMRALDRTRPIAVAGAVTMIVFLGAGIPLMIMFGVSGLAAGIVAQSLAHLAVRVFYLRRLFPGFRFLRQMFRAAVPTLLAVAMVLAARALEHGDRTLTLAVAELAAYGAVVLVFTILIERRLLREVAGYLSKRRSSSTDLGEPAGL